VSRIDKLKGARQIKKKYFFAILLSFCMLVGGLAYVDYSISNIMMNNKKIVTTTSIQKIKKIFNKLKKDTKHIFWGTYYYIANAFPQNIHTILKYVTFSIRLN